jgi:protein-disulfide isomerase
MIKKILLGILMLGMVALAAILIFENYVYNQRVKFAELPWSSNSETNKDAPITIVNFVDYSCPYCHEFHPLLNQAIENDNSFNIVIKPVGLLNQNSEDIAMIIMAAGLQKQDGDLHNAIMKLPHPISPDDVYKAAETLPIDMNKLRDIATSDEMRIALKQNNNLFYTLGFKAVPTILINGRAYSPTGDMPSPDTLKKILKN